MSYGADQRAIFRRAATYIDNLPVEQPTKFEALINLKTAKVLGLTIPGGNSRSGRRAIE
jgi:putative tryptophan/tyrosine transport system substrate-binding protein